MDSALYNAVSSGDYDGFVRLINADPGLLRQTTKQQNTVLHVAAEFNQKEIAEEILQRQNSILYETNFRDETALHFAARFGNVEVVEVVIENAKRYGLESEKEVLKMVDVGKETAVHAGVRNGRREVVKRLLEECPELADCRNEDGESAMFVAVEKGLMEIAFEILQLGMGSSCSYMGRQGSNVLHALVIRTLKPYTQSLYETPVRVYLSLPVMFLNTFLPQVMQFPYWERKIIRKLSPPQQDFFTELLNKFPQILKEADDEGWLPLHYAANLGSEELINLILQHQTSLAYKSDKLGISALHIAAKEGRVAAIKAMMKHHPDVCELLDHKNRTALHVAVANGQAYAVKQMLQMPSFMRLVNQRDVEGNTALHMAAITGNYVILTMLVSNGRVDKTIVNEDGHTTNDLIRSSNQFRWYEKSSIIARLEFHGALRGMREVLKRPTTEKNTAIEKKALIKDDGEEENVKNEIKPAIKPITEQHKSSIWGEISEAYLVVATIIATLTYSSATFQVPGGYNSHDGQAVLKNNIYFRLYILSNSISFGYAAASMFVTFFSGLFGRDYGFSYPTKWVAFLTGTSLWFMVSSFMFGTSATMAETSGFALLVRAVACLSFIWPVFLLGALAVNWFAYFP